MSDQSDSQTIHLMRIVRESCPCGCIRAIGLEMQRNHDRQILLVDIREPDWARHGSIRFETEFDRLCLGSHFREDFERFVDWRVDLV